MTTKNLEQIKEELNAKIPRDAIQERDAGFGGKKLSYLAGHYVIDRLNLIFGPENWSYTTYSLNKTYEGEVNGKFYSSYVATVMLTTRFPNGNTRIDTDVGFGDGQDKSNPGKTHELAVKEAVTDGLKRCAKSLGMSMGLALYDKDQTNVEEETTPPLAVKAKPQTDPSAQKSDATKPTDKGSAIEENIKAAIRSAVTVLQAKGTLTTEAFISKYLGTGKKVKDLDAKNAAELWKRVQSDFPEVAVKN